MAWLYKDIAKLGIRLTRYLRLSLNHFSLAPLMSLILHVLLLYEARDEDFNRKTHQLSLYRSLWLCSISTYKYKETLLIRFVRVG